MDLFFHTNKSTATERKLRGGYYTPEKLAAYLSNWAIRHKSDRVLEPSCGDGNFLVPVLDKFSSLGNNHPQLVVVELETDELLEAQKRIKSRFSANGSIEWRFGDFFKQYESLQRDKFDVVIGNPPFIRFQHIQNESRDVAFKHLKNASYKPTKLANIWSAFVQLSIELLKEDGRMAMVLPAELLQVKYAGELRNRLVKCFKHIIIIGFRKLVFPDIQQEVVLLLAEGKQQPNGVISDIHTLELENGKELLNEVILEDAVKHLPARHSHPEMKWTSLFLSNQAVEALEKAGKSKGLVKLGKLADVDIGIVTGRNSFFVIDEKRKNALAADNFSVPLVGRTGALKSLIFNESDFEKYKVAHPAFLLNFNIAQTGDIPKSLLQYIAHGEKEGVNKGYKCRIRKRWFDVPSIYIPDAFLFRQIHRYPLMVVNEAKATSTDTVHRVRVKEGVNPATLACTFFNSLTLAWAEVAGRSYGGGVLELEPGEAEKLLIPWKDGFDLDVKKVDELLRNGQELQALDYVDSIVLEKHLGFDREFVLSIRKAWEELRDRRINRK